MFYCAIPPRWYRVAARELNRAGLTAGDEVAPDSATETFAAVRFQIDNWRWQGVPFILWSGKRLRKKVSEVMIRFRKPPFNLFDTQATVPAASALVFRLQPDPGVVLRMNAKQPGLTTDIQRLVMRAPFADDANEVADAYEILMHAVFPFRRGGGILGDRRTDTRDRQRPGLHPALPRRNLGPTRHGDPDPGLRGGLASPQLSH